MDWEKLEEALVYIRGAMKDYETWLYVAGLLSEALGVDVNRILFG